jgi:DNA-binding response OmpR family regulator
LAGQSNLLLVLPDPALVTRVSHVLAPLGFRISTAADGVEALSHADRTTPDLVIAELALPRLDGVSVLKALRSRPSTRRTPVIFLSGRRDAATLLEVLAVGARCCLPIPFLDEELLDRVGRVLGR